MNDEIEKLNNEIKICTKCRLHQSRKNAVPGEGNPHAEIMFIGEAPGYNEDIQGRPFVGAAGKFLTELIVNILKIPRSSVYITNVVKCRPPENRDPYPDEIQTCTPYLDKQIAIIKPKIIVTLGRHSTNYILTKSGIKIKNITSVRGQLFDISISGINVRVMPTLHPAAALYNPQLRSQIEEDFKKLRETMYKEATKKGLEIYF
ncbi:MAG: type-4 uracil-DNA glycosylase [Thermoprotei archaeon]|jgi:DNA polymerase